MLERIPRLVCGAKMATGFVSAPLLAPAGHGVQAYTNYGTLLHLGASASLLLFVYGGGAAGRLELDAAAQAVLQLDHPLQRNEWLAVLIAIESGQHSCMVVERGHRRP